MTTDISTANGLAGNFRNLLFHFGLLSEEVPGVTLAAAEAAVGDIIHWFTIEVNGERYETKVEAGKFKSALLLLYLAQLAQREVFIRCEADRNLIEAYFGVDIVADALNNSATKHTTVRHLLAEGSVKIIVNQADVA